ncbi:hypothetical protein C2U68_17235 [Methylomonas koyamae]|nr:hypothetical protein C2U68_17235 [Methylomonas koyamae]
MGRKKTKRTNSVAFRTTSENDLHVMGRAECMGITPSEYLHRLLTQDRINAERELIIMAKAHGFNVNKANKAN